MAAAGVAALAASPPVPFFERTAHRAGATGRYFRVSASPEARQSSTRSIARFRIRVGAVL